MTKSSAARKQKIIKKKIVNKQPPQPPQVWMRNVNEIHYEITPVMQWFLGEDGKPTLMQLHHDKATKTNMWFALPISSASEKPNEIEVK